MCINEMYSYNKITHTSTEIIANYYFRQLDMKFVAKGKKKCADKRIIYQNS